MSLSSLSQLLRALKDNKVSKDAQEQELIRSEQDSKKLITKMKLEFREQEKDENFSLKDTLNLLSSKKIAEAFELAQKKSKGEERIKKKKKKRKKDERRERRGKRRRGKRKRRRRERRRRRRERKRKKRKEKKKRRRRERRRKRGRERRGRRKFGRRDCWRSNNSGVFRARRYVRGSEIIHFVFKEKDHTKDFMGDMRAIGAPL